MATRLIELVERLPGAHVALVGDFMMDRYVFGRTDRVSPEAPIPVLRYQREEYRLGGAGFVAAALATLGATVRAIGIVGDDPAGAELRQRLVALSANVDGILTLPGRPTVTKMRLLGASEDKSPQQMLRLDIEQTTPADAAVEQRLIAAATAAFDAGATVLCIEDYDKGAVTANVCRRLIEEARQRNVPVLVDPARLNDYAKYAGATALKLNRPEAERATGLPARDSVACEAAAKRLIDQLGLEATVITLNDRGAYLRIAGEMAGEVLASRQRQVADATGAGDMVLAALAVARAAGASWHDAVALANVVGGLEVEKLGCVPITPDEIIHDLMAEHHETAGKRRTIEALLPELERHRAAGRKIVFTNGCFDLIHLGHVKYFQFAKAQGDVLVVGVNTDAGIRRLKGEKRPIVNEHDRIEVLAELESIDYLVPFEEDTPVRLIEQLRPDVLVKGADYAKHQVVGWDLVESRGGRVALAPLIDGRSTSAVIQRILEAYR